MERKGGSGSPEELLAEWSLDVKIRAGWVCEHPGCGELDRELLESHHIKSKYYFPELALDPENGKCLCLWHHAVAHRKDPRVRDAILARLAVKLYLRSNRTRSKEEVYNACEKPPDTEYSCHNKDCPARQIFALWLQDCEGLILAEIADKMKTTVPAVKHLLFQIRHREDFMKMLPKKARNRLKRRVLRYQDSMADQVVKKI